MGLPNPSRETKFSGTNADREISIFFCSADHVQDWQPYPVDQYSCYIQHAHFIPIVGVGKRGAYELVHGDLPRQHSFGTTLRFTGPVPADSRQ